MVTENANGDEWVISESGISDVCNDSNSDCQGLQCRSGLTKLAMTNIALIHQSVMTLLEMPVKVNPGQTESLAIHCLEIS